MFNQLIYGNEPFFVNAYKKEVAKDIFMPSFNLCIANQFTNQELEFVQQAPISSKRRVLILEFEKMCANEKLELYLKNPVSKTDVYLFVSECDKRLTLYKLFSKSSIKMLDKATPEFLEKWIVGYVNKRGCQITQKAYMEFTERINYKLEGVNLYHVKMMLNRLCVTDKVITPELVKCIVPKNEKEDIFQLIRLIDENKADELFHQAMMILQNQNVIGTMALLLRSYRIVYKVNVTGCSLSNMGVYFRTYIPKLTKEQSSNGINIIQACINGIKSGKYLPEMGFRLCLAQLCQIKNI